MEFKIKSGSPEKQRSRCLVLAVFENRELSRSAAAINTGSGKLISNLLKRGDITGETGSILLVPNAGNLPATRLMLVGCGKSNEFNSKKLMEVTNTVISSLQRHGIGDADLFLPELETDDCGITGRIENIVIQAEMSAYRYETTLSDKKTSEVKPGKLSLFIPDRNTANACNKAVSTAKAIASGINLARQLGNLPGNICTPTYLADEARNMAKELGIKTTVLGENAMQKLGMGALLSVSRGSRQEAKLIIMEHKAGPKKQKPVVLVGKGLTFDAGGISIKPSAAMDEMKFDMCGGASVLGTMRAIAEMGLPINVTGIVPSSENLPDGDANKPGDIVTSMSGQTIEVLNTDAEGRLILCDALTYAERYKPAAVVDIATLTGACVVALGSHATGLFSHTDDLADELIQAGEKAHDRAWRMPLWEEYDSQLKSNFADMANIGGPKAGAITAASFLARYTKKFNWAHLDIAGTAWHSGDNKGATGRPVRMLCQFLRNRAGDSSP